MRNKKVLITITLLSILCIACIFTAFAHSGRTDSSGGHWNNSTGTYHYHCGGYPAHSHSGGVCPYKTSSSSSSSTDEYDDGYNDGYKEGLDDGYKQGYDEGHSDGYNESYDEHLEQYEELEKLKIEKVELEETTTTFIICLLIIILFLCYKAFFSKRR